jgi:hypothetical protein
MSVISATKEAVGRGLRSKASLSKVSERPNMKTKLKAKGLEMWLKW